MDVDRSKARASTPEEEEASKQEILRSSPFSGLSGASREALLTLGRIEQLPRRHQIAAQGEVPASLLLLGSGRVKLERKNGDRIFPLGHRGPGEIVGEAAIVGAQIATENASVLDEVEALALPLAGFRKLLLTDVPLRAAMTAVLLEQRRSAEERLASLLLHGVEVRLVRFLCEAAHRWGRPHTSGTLISAPFTHADIALLIGSTRETVTLLLGKLKRADLITFDRRRVIIRDRDALERHGAAS